jgi:hypothetical protein
MHRHRLAAEAEYYRIPEPALARINPAKIVIYVLPIGHLHATGIAGLSELYRLALDRARAQARGTHPGRILETSWN